MFALLQLPLDYEFVIQLFGSRSLQRTKFIPWSDDTGLVTPTRH